MTTLNQFINQKHITIESEMVGENPNMSDPSWNAYHYKVTLVKTLPCRRQLTTYFSMRVGSSRKPKVEDVLDCLISDASGYENARTFEEWAGDHGYEKDSRKAYATWQIISKQVKRLHQFLGDDYERVLWEIER